MDLRTKALWAATMLAAGQNLMANEGLLARPTAEQRVIELTKAQIDKTASAKFNSTCYEDNLNFKVVLTQADLQYFERGDNGKRKPSALLAIAEQIDARKTAINSDIMKMAEAIRKEHQEALGSFMSVFRFHMKLFEAASCVSKEAISAKHEDSEDIAEGALLFADHANGLVEKASLKNHEEALAGLQAAMKSSLDAKRAALAAAWGDRNTAEFLGTAPHQPIGGVDLSLPKSFDGKTN